jgi:hypothetical protein
MMGEAAAKLIELEETPRTTTLLELVAAIADCADSEDEVIEAVAHLINTRQVLLVGNFCGADVEVR